MSGNEAPSEAPQNIGAYLLIIGMVTVAFGSVFRFTFSAAIGRFLLIAVGVVALVSLVLVLVIYQL
ncbi:MAG: hypothetical protein V5A36_01680 [Natronomonas sp.]